LTRPFRRALLAWYDASQRDLPWRRNNDFYPVWISEIMLQQTRVEAVIPYFNRFLSRFPDIEALAKAPESDVLAAWSGLGYYSRARNLHRAAQSIVAQGHPDNYEQILALPGIGPYTAAAIASIVLGLPHAAVDGNVLRVLSRLKNDASEISLPTVRSRFTNEAQALLDPRRPGDFNQALMELGATVCLPRNPLCGECPVQRFCEGRAAGRERELPIKRGKDQARDIALDLVVIARADEVLLIRRGPDERRLPNFWELPQRRAPIRGEKPVAAFTHRIVNDRFRITVYRREPPVRLFPESGEWFTPERMARVPVTTVARKALALAERSKRPPGSTR
jgi:A/G-specific adenine glycosylase